jgi:hypothetical protein
MLTVQMAVQCKSPKCKGVPTVAVITVESQRGLDNWMKKFAPQVITCKICQIASLYSRQDLIVGPKENFFTKLEPES